MRAGKLAHLISIERDRIVTPDAYGVPTPALLPVMIATLKAEKLFPKQEEFFRAYGEAEEESVVFRTRFVAGVTTDDRIIHEGRTYDIRQVVEIGRRRGLELRAVLRAG